MHNQHSTLDIIYIAEEMYIHYHLCLGCGLAGILISFNKNLYILALKVTKIVNEQRLELFKNKFCVCAENCRQKQMAFQLYIHS